MPRKHKLKSKLDNDGIFWNPGAPDVSFPGKLSKTGKHIHLTSSAVFEKIDNSKVSDVFAQMNNSIRKAQPEVLFGIVDGAPCTLFWLYQFDDGGFTDIGRMQAVTYKQFGVNLCVVGLHIEAPSADVITSARITYTALKYWIRPKLNLSITKDAFTFTFARETPPVIDVLSNDSQVRFKFDIEPRMRHEHGELRTVNEAALQILPSVPRSVEWFFERAYRVQGYFALITGSSLQIRSVEFKIGEQSGSCRRPERGVSEEVRQGIAVRLTPMDMGKSLIAWAALPASFRPLEGLLFAIREEKVSTETGFLSVAKALEGFQRLTYTSPTKARVTLEMRMKELLSRVSAGLTERVLGDAVLFEAKLRATRDYLTHPGLPRKPEVITETRQLYLLRMSCEVLLRLVILLHIGLSEDLLADPIYQHSRLWS